MEDKVIFDPEAIRELRVLDENDATGLVHSLIVMFEDTTEKTIRAMISAADANDAETLGHLAHTLCSTSGNLGARRFSFICAEIERITMYEKSKVRLVCGDLAHQLMEILPETMAHLLKEKN